ncbi:IPT/TIG domain-containing protein [Niveibacterium sp. COAC-50]|uniref:IPT/TIG domain-containing protein n=1 Tax=Niveibacterium sp. COAC-50 TaxID=2729384 RepID=UPI001555114A|nr:IPT/TIG domain-containing protein [Niveibacterium sp. COAC-50]
MHYLYRFLILFLSAAFVAGCGGGGGGGGGTQTATVTVTGLSPSFAFPGDTVTVIGTNFNSVTGLRLGTADVPFTLISTTRLSFVVPDSAVSGTVTLVSGTATVDSPTTLTVLGVPQVSSVSPTSARPGDSLTLTGTNLANVSQVRVGGVAVTPTARTGTQLIVVVPAGAADGSLALVLSNGSSRTLTQTFTLLPALISVSAMSPTSGPEGVSVQVTGLALDTVTGVSVGGVAATVLDKTATSLDFAAPAKSGNVILSGPGGQSVQAGVFTLTTGSAPVVTISRVDVAQAYSQPVGATYQFLVPGKIALVRAYISANQRIASPKVTATISGCAASPTLTLTGPSALPTTAPALDDLAGTFSAQIPASCVQSGLQIGVTVANTSPANSGATRSATPSVGRPTNLNLVLVPLVTNNSTGTVPDVEVVRRMFARAYPIDASRITISVRTPYTLATKTVSGTVADSWSNALQEVRQLRDLEGGGKHYYGLVPSPGFSGGTSGLAYQNGATNSGGGAWLAAIGLDSVALAANRFGANAWLDTMTHEVGHNMSLGHAPCGGATDAEADFPYAGGGLGPYPVHEFDSDRNGTVGPETVYFPATSVAHDVMGYCDSEWFSDYNYSRVQTFMQSFTYPQITPFAEPIEMLDFFGDIRDGKVRLAPPGARMSTQPYAAGGAFTLRVTTAVGAVVEVPFTPVKVADEAGSSLQHFHVALPNPGTIAKVEVLQGAMTLPLTLDSPPVAAAQSVGDTATSASPLSWSEANGVLSVTWDAARYPVLRVRQLGTEPMVLALQLTGGKATLPLTGVPAGGKWEFSLSGGFNARSLTLAR